MAIKKQFLKSKPVCKVTFKIPKEKAEGFKTASVVGDFNDWNSKKNKMTKVKADGSFTAAIEFDLGQTIQFRYLLDNSMWMNEPQADKELHTEFPDATNSVLIT
ncbi:MAG: isoamylase early set domain-containing protein [Ignavibacteriales bacterium]|nr:isoamylase early set domain-containing protein [Ignavibacteriales bacterium]